MFNVQPTGYLPHLLPRISRSNHFLMILPGNRQLVMRIAIKVMLSFACISSTAKMLNDILGEKA